ncbi:acyl-CoA N-acyltransferase [Flammula alnicola]|nr:acyl-CoA N-acyltransferase [Flammula alnicola]
MAVITLRDATKQDLSQLVDIMNYYIENSVASLRTDTLNSSTGYQDIFDNVQSQHLPFFVAIDNSRVGRIAGFTYATGFRMPAYQGYRHTVEITIYIHPEYRGQSVGSKLMDALMDALKSPVKLGAPEIKQVLSIMTLDENGPGNGYGLRDWYGRWGFFQIGHMKRVGFKHGRWIDVLIMQASLEE